jgi:hypothetical protein
MEHTDPRNAHPHQASTDERACLSTPQDGADAAPAAPEDDLPDPHCFQQPDEEGDPGPWADFASEEEAQAYFKGMMQGLRNANREPGHPHMPADFSLDLMRPPEAPSLTSTKMVDAFPLVPGEGEEKKPERHDGWTGAKMQRFLHILGETGVVTDACRATGMSRRSAYALRNSARGRAFALGWDAALLLSTASVADDVASRSRYGVIDRVYRNGELVSERHHYDNRLTMAVLTRLDRQVKEMRADQAAAARIVADEWDQYTGLIGAGEGAEAFLAARAPAAPGASGAAPVPCGCGDAASEAALLGRLATFRRFGAGLPSEIPLADLDPAAMESWTDDQIARAEASGFLARLAPEAWPETIREGQGDGTDGMCDLRYLYLKYAPPPAAAAAAAVVGDADDGEFDPDAPADDYEGCIVWQKSDLSWWTDFPPPPGFDGFHEGELGTHSYIRTLTDDERRMMIGGEEEDEPDDEGEASGEAAELFYDDEEGEEPITGARAARLRKLQAARRRFFDIDAEEERSQAEDAAAAAAGDAQMQSQDLGVVGGHSGDGGEGGDGG